MLKEVENGNLTGITVEEVIEEKQEHDIIIRGYPGADESTLCGQNHELPCRM